MCSGPLKTIGDKSNVLLKNLLFEEYGDLKFQWLVTFPWYG
jgi:hypothetical protein